MKLFEFITNIFKVQEEVKELNNESIIDYTREFISENTYRFNSECSDSLNLFKKKINELKDNISLLENAEIPKAPPTDEKAKLIILDNRNAYIRHLKGFLNEIEIDKFELENFPEFYTKFNYLINEFGKKTERNFYIVHTTLKESSNVASSLKQADEILKEIKERYDKFRLVEVYEIKNKVNLYLKSQDEGTIAVKQRKAIDEKLKQIDDKRLELAKKIDEIRTSPKFIEVIELKKRKSEIDSRIKELRQKALEQFMPLDKALKKYSKLNKEFLVAKYSEEPFEALVLDEELKIVEYLKNIKDDILTLDLDEKKMERALNTIELLSSEKLKQLQEEYNKIASEHKMLRNKITYNQMEEKANMLQTELDNIIENQKLLRKKLSELNERTVVNENELKNEIVSKLKGFNREVVFKEVKADSIPEEVVQDDSTSLSIQESINI
ncbi:hypothetical protein J4403_02635 [Candidatus Woesearchaeota archaeon]|nr:hypothetical protein [Candidatus Woesearchaeota archaeon]